MFRNILRSNTRQLGFRFSIYEVVGSEWQSFRKKNSTSTYMRSNTFRRQMFRGLTYCRQFILSIYILPTDISWTDMLPTTYFIDRYFADRCFAKNRDIAEKIFLQFCAPYYSVLCRVFCKSKFYNILLQRNAYTGKQMSPLYIYIYINTEKIVVKLRYVIKKKHIYINIY